MVDETPKPVDPTAPVAPVAGSQYNYSKFRTKHITIDQLDEMVNFVLESPNGKYGSIIAGLKLLVIFAYVWTRKRLVDEDMQMFKQEYEQRQSVGAKAEIINEDKDNV